MSIKLKKFTSENGRFFKEINKEWVEEMFSMEPFDLELLDLPKENIVDKGGEVWFAHHPELGYVGTAALLSVCNKGYELIKMGVLKKARGLKIGEILLKQMIERAKALGAEDLFLLTNKKCEAAIYLYEKHGFIHSQRIKDQYGHKYDRCDVAMEFKWAVK